MWRCIDHISGEDARVKLNSSAERLLELFERLDWAEECDGRRLLAVCRYGRRKKQDARPNPSFRHPVPESLHLDVEVLPRRGEGAQHGHAELARTSAEMASSPLGWFGVGDASLNKRPALVSDLGEVPDLVLVQGRRELFKLEGDVSFDELLEVGQAGLALIRRHGRRSGHLR